MLEGQSTHRPPLFIGSDYGYWKNRMIMYIKGQDYHVWRIIANGPHIPTKTVEGATLAKLESEWNEADVRLIELNCKAMSTLYCALDPIEYNRVSGCDSAKEIWDKLEVTYEGTNQVKESKMNMLVHEYELFVMKKDENISEMSTRFTNIVNSLKALGKIYTNQENVRKILRSLPKRWEAKMTAISEARDLKVLTLEELFGSLMTYELEMNSKVEEEEVKPKKNFALKSSHHDHDNSEEERDEEEEIALMTRNFKKFLKKKKGFGRRFPKKGENKGESSKTETPTCYKCKKQGHYKNECPQVNKEKMKYKKKALKVTWDDSDESDSDNNSSDNEVANLCLLGYINESNISEDEHASFCPLAFNDDESATEDLCLMAHGDENRLRLKTTIECVKWLAMQACAFRGHDESSESSNRGNFVEMLKYTASINENITEVILENAPGNAKYTSPDIQKEILNILATRVRNKIREEIGDAKFCILVDEVLDESNREQMAIVLRFVNCDGFVQEPFFDVVGVDETSAKTLKKGICNVLTCHNLQVENMRGQGYDGASNMRGAWNGLQALFLKDCPYAYYLNSIVNLVGVSPKRHMELKNIKVAELADMLESGELATGKGANQSRSLQQPGATRWGSHFGAVSKLIEIFTAAQTVLEIMGITDCLCQVLQRKSQDIINALDLVSATKCNLQKLRQDGWDAFIGDVTSFCISNKIDMPDMSAHYKEDNRFTEQTTRLLVLSSALNPVDGFKSFKIDDICSLASEFYLRDFTQVEMDWLKWEKYQSIS
uniref:CCHC-type domain-containing protein n=1 Tax=Fagus sylvatica TaxID=28930 RepID=A0A2N9IKX4_FAGSY